jgi:hypothetical protein
MDAETEVLFQITKLTFVGCFTIGFSFPDKTQVIYFIIGVLWFFAITSGSMDRTNQKGAEKVFGYLFFLSLASASGVLFGSEVKNVLLSTMRQRIIRT